MRGDSERFGPDSRHGFLAEFSLEPADRGEDRPACNGQGAAGALPVPSFGYHLFSRLPCPRLRPRAAGATVLSDQRRHRMDEPVLRHWPLRNPQQRLCSLQDDDQLHGCCRGQVLLSRDTRDVVGVLSLTHDPEPHFEMTTFDATLPSFVSEAQQKVTLPYLLESSHELFLVCLFFHGCSLERIGEVGAYRMDFSSKKWCKVTDIGDTAFLLGPASFAASCSAMEHGLRRSCVYFAYDFLGDSNSFHIFDLREGTRELAGPTRDIPVLARKPFWMVSVLSESCFV
jgi:hypothetical protein